MLFPGAGFVELVIRAGDEVGCPVVEELTLQAPLVVPPSGAPVRVLVGAADGSGSRAVSVSRAPAGRSPVRTGRCTPRRSSPRGAPSRRWPICRCGHRPVPPQSTSRTHTHRWRRAATSTARRCGSTAMWRRGDEVFAEVALPQDVQAGEFGVHPALLDASLHALAIAADDRQLALPFSWQRVSLHAAGASAVRVRLAPTRRATRCRSNSPTGWGCPCCRWGR